MRIPRWLVALAVVAIVLLAANGVISQPRQVQIPIGMIVRDRHNHNIRLPEGVKIDIFRIGVRTLSRFEWASVSGKPDAEGYLRTQATVTVESRLMPVVNQLLK